MPVEYRGNLTIACWFLSALVLGALFISATAQGELTSTHVLLAFVILGLAIAGTAFIWRFPESETEQAKAKRRHIDSLLSDMSDEELIELKQRLADVDAKEAPITDYLGDDGELVQRR
jgi:hypothetical protein